MQPELIQEFKNSIEQRYGIQAFFDKDDDFDFTTIVISDNTLYLSDDFQDYVTDYMVAKHIDTVAVICNSVLFNRLKFKQQDSLATAITIIFASLALYTKENQNDKQLAELFASLKASTNTNPKYIEKIEHISFEKNFYVVKHEKQKNFEKLESEQTFSNNDNFSFAA